MNIPGAGHPPYNKHAAPAARQPHPERAPVQVPAPATAALPQAVAAHIATLTYRPHNEPT